MATSLITGGTSGLGAEFARQLAARGDALILVARNQDRLAEVATDLRERYGIAVETISADLGVPEDVQKVAARLASVEQPVDLLVNNAGFGIRIKLTAEDLSPHESGIDVMIRAVLILGAAAGRAMSARRSGIILNVSSTSGFIAMGGYSAIKAWVTAYSEGLAGELAGTGVTVTALCPGWIRTEFHTRASIRTGTIPEPMWLDLRDVVSEGLADAYAGKVISIPSRRYRFLMFLVRHLPRRWVRSVSRRMMSGRH